MKHKLIAYLQLELGAVLFGLAAVWFLNPSNLNAGGLVGFSQILSWLTTRDQPNITGILNFLINIPLFLLAMRKISFSFCFRTLLAIVTQSLIMQVVPPLSQPVMDTTLANCLIGAFMAGAGIGLCLRSGGCGGGMDILGVYFSKVSPNFSVGRLSYIINGVVLTISAFLFNIQTALYSLIFAVLAYAVSDRVHIQNINVWALIFTENKELKMAIARRMVRGVTWWDGKGAWTGSHKEILVTAISKYEVRRLKKICAELDPDCFLIINDGGPVQGNFARRLTDS